MNTGGAVLGVVLVLVARMVRRAAAVASVTRVGALEAAVTDAAAVRREPPFDELDGAGRRRADRHPRRARTAPPDPQRSSTRRYSGRVTSPAVPDAPARVPWVRAGARRRGGRPAVGRVRRRRRHPHGPAPHHLRRAWTSAARRRPRSPPSCPPRSRARSRTSRTARSTSSRRSSSRSAASSAHGSGRGCCAASRSGGCAGCSSPCSSSVAVRMVLVVPVRGDRLLELDVLPILGMVALGIVIGIASGLFGIGGGIIMVPAFIALFGMSDLVAKGTSLAVMIPTAISGTVANTRARPRRPQGRAHRGARRHRRLVRRRRHRVPALARSGRRGCSRRSWSSRRCSSPCAPSDSSEEGSRGVTSGRARIAGWYDDEADAALLRYWDGSKWSPHTAPRADGCRTARRAHVRGRRAPVAALFDRIEATRPCALPPPLARRAHATVPLPPRRPDACRRPPIASRHAIPLQRTALGMERAGRLVLRDAARRGIRRHPRGAAHAAGLRRGAGAGHGRRLDLVDVGVPRLQAGQLRAPRQEGRAHGRGHRRGRRRRASRSRCSTSDAGRSAVGEPSGPARPASGCSAGPRPSTRGSAARGR